MQTQDTLFEAMIVPHRSLSRRGWRVLLTALALAGGAVSAGFAWIGAWPIGGFTGVELGVAVLLFRLNIRSARESELLMLSPAELRIIRTDANGRRRESVLPPGWLGVRLQDRPGRVPALLLVAHGITEEVARSLGEAEKRDLAAALAAALHRWRNPRFDNPQLRE